jgi:hypothetical protein
MDVPVKRCAFQIKAVLVGTALEGSVFTEVEIFCCVDEIATPSAQGRLLKMWRGDLETALGAAPFRAERKELD